MFVNDYECNYYVIPERFSELSGFRHLSACCSSDALSISASGGSDCYVKGAAQQLSIEVSGGSDVECGQLDADDVTIIASRGSDVYVVAN